MNLKQIEVLRTVIECQTTIKAGRALGMSQPAVSNALKHLETQLGFPLFERINNRLFTTPQARALYAESEALFETYRAFTERLEAIKTQNHETLRLFATPPLGHALIPIAMRRFLARNARVRMHYDIASFSQVLHGIEVGLMDLGFVIGQVDESAFHIEPLYAGHMVCVMPADHPLAARPEISAADLSGHAFISLDPSTGMGQTLRRAFQSQGVPLNFVAETRYCNTACMMVQHGVGIAVVDPLSAAAATSEAILTRPFAGSEILLAQAVHSKARVLSKPARAFLREVRRAAETMPGWLPPQPTAAPSPASAP